MRMVVCVKQVYDPATVKSPAAVEELDFAPGRQADQSR